MIPMRLTGIVRRAEVGAAEEGSHGRIILLDNGAGGRSLVCYFDSGFRLAVPQQLTEVTSINIAALAYGP